MPEIKAEDKGCRHGAAVDNIAGVEICCRSIQGDDRRQFIIVGPNSQVRGQVFFGVSWDCRSVAGDDGGVLDHVGCLVQPELLHIKPSSSRSVEKDVLACQVANFYKTTLVDCGRACVCCGITPVVADANVTGSQSFLIIIFTLSIDEEDELESLGREHVDGKPSIALDTRVCNTLKISIY